MDTNDLIAARTMAEYGMKIVNTNLDGKLSLVDKVWNDAIETAALHVENHSRSYRHANGDDERVWDAAKRLDQIATELRAVKRASPA